MAKLLNKKKLVIFDFDYTLYDPDKWRKRTFLRLADLFHENPVQFQKKAEDVYYQTRRIGYFDPVLFARELINRMVRKVSLEKVLAVIYYTLTFKKCYYTETEKVLHRLKGLAEFAIFSTNDETFFQAKFSTIKKYFQNSLVFISHDKHKIIYQLTQLTTDYQLYVIDDIIDVLKALKNLNKNIITVWIKRGPYAQKQGNLQGFMPDFTIDNLQEIVSLISIS